MQIPYDSIPDYNDYIRTAVTLESMKDKLTRHQYSSLGQCSFDFYAMLNNARSVTTSTSEVCHNCADRLHHLSDNTTRPFL